MTNAVKFIELYAWEDIHRLILVYNHASKLRVARAQTRPWQHYKKRWQLSRWSIGDCLVEKGRGKSHKSVLEQRHTEKDKV